MGLSVSEEELVQAFSRFGEFVSVVVSTLIINGNNNKTGCHV